MNKLINLILIFLSLLVSCKESNVKDDLQNEYERLAKDRDVRVIVNDIELLESISVDFERLANHEVEKLEEINEVRRQELLKLREIDSLVIKKIENTKCISKNANSDWKIEYSEQMKLDSIRLVKNKLRIFCVELEKSEDEIKIFNIYRLAKSDSISMSENLVIKHIID